MSKKKSNGRWRRPRNVGRSKKEKERERKRKRIKETRERELILRLERFSGDLPATAAQRCNIQTTFLRARWRLACTYHRWLHGGGYTLSPSSLDASPLSLSLSLFPLRFLALPLQAIPTGLSRECSPPRFRTPFSSILYLFRLSFSSLPLPASYLRSNAIYRRWARRANLPFSSISTWLIARLRTTGIELLAVVWNFASLFCEILVASWSTRTNGLLRFISPSSIMNSATDQIYTGLTAAKGSIVMRFFRTIWDDRVLNDRFIGRLLSHSLSS